MRLSGTVYCRKGEFGPSAPFRQLKVLATSLMDLPSRTSETARAF